MGKGISARQRWGGGGEGMQLSYILCIGGWRVGNGSTGWRIGNGSKGYAWVNWVAWVGIGAGGALALALALG